MSDLERQEVPDGIETPEWTLDVTGAVDVPLSFTRDDLGAFPRESFVDDFVREEGWAAEGLRWEGIRVESILDRIGVSDAGEYGLVRALDAGHALEHGGPARLVPVADDRDCWENIKWVSSIEIREAEPTAADTAEGIALSRIT